MRGVIRGHEPDTTYWMDGKQVSKEAFDLAFPRVHTEAQHAEGLMGWEPLLSDAMAVHPKQVDEAEADAKKKGVPTEFEREFGRPIFTSRAHRKAYIAAYSIHDRNGGYGD